MQVSHPPRCRPRAQVRAAAASKLHIMRRNWWGLVGLVALLLPAVPARAALFDTHSVRAEVLPNGLRVIVAEEPEASAVSVELVVEAGTAVERPSQSGAAHLLEHVLWAYGGPDDPRAAIEDLGGVTNVGTLRDLTHYYGTVPAGPGAAAAIVRALARMVERRQLSETVIAREKRVIEEGTRGERRPAGPAPERARLCGRVRCGSPLLAGRLQGDKTVFKQLTATALGSFQRTWYVPNNMAVVAAGPGHAGGSEGRGGCGFRGAAAGAGADGGDSPLPRPSKGREVRHEIRGDKAYLMVAGWARRWRSRRRCAPRTR